MHIGGQEITPVGPVRVYVCGITPYAVTHLGHAATFVWTDLAARVLRGAGHQVQVARNITDVDEDLFAEARRIGQPYDELAALQRFSFEQTMAALGVRPPEHQPVARYAVHQVIQLVQALLARGAAYVVGGTVYARTSDVAARAGLGEAEALALAAEYGDYPGDPGDPAREQALDSVVWRAAAEGEVSWASPWGAGRPGWHAECAAMVLATYGPGIDLHAGGADLRFPHHAVEALLAELATGVAPFARAWLHPGTVRVGGAKMAKSTGNLVLVEALLQSHDPGAVRLLCLHRSVSEAWDYTAAGLAEAEALLAALYAAAGRPGGEAGVAAVDEALRDGLDVQTAVAVALDAGGQAARHVIAATGLAAAPTST